MAAGLRIPAPCSHLADTQNAWLTPNAASACVPGPGRYKERQSFHEETTTSPSQGMLGTGGFASKSKRFTSYSSNGPGPQGYRTSTFKTSYLPGFTGYYFSESSDRESMAMYETDSPGPARYGSVHDSSSPSVPGVKDCRSAFSPGPEREVSVKKEPAPAHSLRGSQPRPLAFSKSCGSFFKATARKRDVLPHPRLPTGSDCFMRLAVMQGRELPGPGEYDQEPLCWSGTSCGAFGTSAFQPSGSTSFIPCAAGPGPGQYEPLRSQRGLKGFSFTTQRINAGSTSVPGPAFYSPSKPKMKADSCHVNRHGLWI